MIRKHWAPIFQSISGSEKMANLPDNDCRLFFCLLLPHCDSWGRVDACARSLGHRVWGLFGNGQKATERALAAIEEVDLVRLYDVGGEAFLEIVDYEEWGGKVGRADRRGESLHPEPPARSTPPKRRSTPSNGGDVTEKVSLARAGESYPILSDPDPIRTKQNRTEQSLDFSPPPASSAPPTPPVEAPAPEKTPRKPATDSHNGFIAWWTEAYRKATTTPKHPEGLPFKIDGRQAKYVQKIREHAGEDLALMIEVAEKYLATPFHATIGVSLKKLSELWPELASSGRTVAANNGQPAESHARQAIRQWAKNHGIGGAA